MTSPDRSKALLAAVSTAVALIIYFFGQRACWHDSPMYPFYALHLFEPLQRLAVADRDPAYPFLIWLTGYTKTHNINGVMFVQALMAAAAPLLICLTLEKISLRLGLVLGWVAVLSGIPYAMQTQQFTDQMHLFLLMVLALAAVRAASCEKPGWLYLTTIIIGLLTFCRPTYYTLMPFAGIVVWLWGVHRRRGGQKFLIHGALSLALMFGLYLGNMWERQMPNILLAEQGRAPVKLTFGGTQVMWNDYRYSRGLHDVLKPEDGPATREFLRRSLLAFENGGGQIYGYANYLDPYVVDKLRAEGTLKDATATPEATVRTFFYYPRFLGWWVFIGTISGKYWSTPDDETLLWHVYVEQVTHHPLILLHTLETGLSELVLTSYRTYNANDEYGYEPYNYDGRRVPQVAFMPVLRIQNCKMEPEMDIYSSYRYMSAGFAEAVQRLFEIIYIPLTIVTGVLFLAGAVAYAAMVWRRSELAVEAITFFLLFLIYWLPNGVMVLMVMMQFRYQAASALLPLMGTGLLLRRLWLDYSSKPSGNA